MDASTSRTRPGTARPAAVTVGRPPWVSASCAQASSRAAARAARIRASSEVSMPSSSRHAVVSEATGPNSSGTPRRTARSVIASPPSASIVARSTATRPRSWPPARRPATARASLKPLVNPVTSAISVNRRVPAWETTPRPSAVTSTRGREPVPFTLRVPSVTGRSCRRQARSSQIRRHFHIPGPHHPATLVNDAG